MRTKKLFELLTLLNGVRSTQWSMVMLLADSIKNKDGIVITKEWYDKWKQSNLNMYPLNLGNLGTWSTFDNTCIDLHFTNNGNNKILCIAKIYDGNSFGGHREELRFTASILLKSSFLRYLHSLIEVRFNNHLETAYENYLDSQKKMWIRDMRNNILNN